MRPREALNLSLVVVTLLLLVYHHARHQHGGVTIINNDPGATITREAPAKKRLNI